MEPIRAFVGHSFADEDAAVVGTILKYLTSLAQLHPNFQWEHAEPPEPRLVSEKVLSLLVNKSQFIAICTRKERVIAAKSLMHRWYVPNWLGGRATDFEWKTSDWIIQEIGIAVGRKLQIVILLEDGVRAPGELQGDLEYIPFNRSAPEKCFGRLSEMIAALSPRTASTAVNPQEARPTESVPESQQATDDDDDTLEPDDTWTKTQYEIFLMFAFQRGDEARASRLHDRFLASNEGASGESRRRWTAWTELCRIRYAREGKLSRLRQQAEEYSGDSHVVECLAKAYRHYGEYDAASKAFSAAASVEVSAERRIELLGQAAISNQKNDNPVDAIKVVEEMRQLSNSTGKGEQEILEVEKELADLRDEEEVAVGALERLVELDPGNVDARFALAFKASALGMDELAAMQYFRIPSAERSGNAWNNIGVAFERLGLPINAIAAYRKSLDMGETIAFSNIAIKYLESGFLPEAEEILIRGIAIKDHHKNVDMTLTSVKSASEAEDTKRTAAFAKAKRLSDFYRGFGLSLAKSMPANIEGAWKDKGCTLELVCRGASIVATGSYEVAHGGLLAMALIGNSGASGTQQATPMRYLVEYQGNSRGSSIIGSVSRRRDDEQSKRVTTIISEAENSSNVLMWVSADGSTIHVLERKGKEAPRFYSLERT